MNEIKNSLLLSPPHVISIISAKHPILNIALVVVLVFGMTVVGCDPDLGNGPGWQQVQPESNTGTLSDDRKEMTFTYDGIEGKLTKEGNGGDSLDGIWYGTYGADTVKMTVSGNNWTMARLDGNSYSDSAKGTFTVSPDGKNVTITVTHIWGGVAEEPPPMDAPSGIPLESSPLWTQLKDTKWIKESAINGKPSIGFSSAGAGTHHDPNSKCELEWLADDYTYDGRYFPLQYSYVSGSKISAYHFPYAHAPLFASFNVVVSGNKLTFSNLWFDDYRPNYSEIVSGIINGTYTKE